MLFRNLEFKKIEDGYSKICKWSNATSDENLKNILDHLYYACASHTE